MPVIDFNIYYLLKINRINSFWKVLFYGNVSPPFISWKGYIEVNIQSPTEHQRRKNIVNFGELIFKNWMLLFVNLLGGKSVNWSTFCMKRGSASF